MTYSQVKEYLYSFINYENLYQYSYKQSFKLERFKEFLNTIDNPQSKLKVIHIAGSKAKGSVCIFIANILKQAGFKVGLYTSPHLIDFRERIRILYKSRVILRKVQDRLKNPERSRGTSRRPQEFKGMISKEEVCKLVARLKPSIDKFNKISKYDALTFFEVYTALAFQYFKEKKVNFVVLETGMGGRLDATNTCRDILSVITPISLEHTYLLGKTVRQIAYEKASIIKKSNQDSIKGKKLALTAKQDRSATRVIENICKRNNTLLVKEGGDFYFSIKSNVFDYKEPDYKIRNLRIKLTGRHQVANASLSIASVRALRYYGINVDRQAIKDGLLNSAWPARFEIISKKPIVVLDGAQNSVSVQALDKTLKENFPNRKIRIIFGIAKDKEIRDTCRAIKSISKNIILTKSNNPRASEPKDLLKYFKNNSIMISNSIQEALYLAKSKVNKKDLIMVTGSLYLCGEAKKIIGGCGV